MNRWKAAYNEAETELDKTYKHIISLNKRFKFNELDSKLNIEFDDYLEELDRFETVFDNIYTAFKEIDFRTLSLENYYEINIHLSVINSKFSKDNYSRDLDLIRELNDRIDSIKFSILPYLYAGSRDFRADYEDKVLQKNKIEHLLNSINLIHQRFKTDHENIVDESEHYLKTINKIKDKFIKIDEKYFTGTEQQPLIEKWNSIGDEIVTKFREIDKFYHILLTDENSIRQEVTSAKEVVLEIRNDSSVTYKKLQEKYEEITIFYQEIYGSKGENEEGSIGLKKDIDARKQELVDFEISQKEKYNALNEQIESLLPRATTTGLSSAYHELCKSYDTSIKNNTLIFFASIVILLGLSWYFLSFKLITLNSIEDFGTFLVYRLPIVIPIVWLAVFASKRRSESERLKQEYAHKEALAKSYQSFKMQIEELGDGVKDPLMEKLLNSAIDTISSNASLTLDKKHGDRPPIMDIIEKTADKVVEKIPFISKVD